MSIVEHSHGPILTQETKLSTYPNSHHSDVGSALARHSSVQDATSLASIDRPPSAEEKLPPSKIYDPLSFPVIALLIPASIFGLLARLGLQALVSYDGHSIFPLAWIQGVGCLVMGFGIGIKEPLGQFYGPLYTALTTGFCGSLTTFSGWQLDVFNSWVNETQSHRDWFRDVIDGLTKTIFTIAISLSGVSFGNHLAMLVKPLSPRLSLPNRTIRYIISAVSVLMYAAVFPTFFRMSVHFRHEATAALLFAFPGTLTRYLLSVRVNPLLKVMPLGTFTANMLGTALLGTFHVLQNKPTPVSPYACSILQGLADGYCGCLTTISTFAVEISTLETPKAWFYVTASWVTAQLLLLVIMGSSFWAGHVSEQTTCAFQ